MAVLWFYVSMKGIYLDSETNVTGEFFALVYAPGRQRNRFPESNVEIMGSPEQALAHALPEKKIFAAKVMGPARSSEGLKLYYLMEWLGEL